QIQAGRELLSHHDVVVESPTGSGKTLAYLLPMFTILEKRGTFRKHEFGAVILSPSRELSIQIASVAAPFAAKLDYSVVVTVGGTKVEQNLKKLKNGNKKVIKIKESSNLVSPSTLNNFYTVCEASEKLICVVEFIRSKPDKKVLVFFPSCGGVKYFHTIDDFRKSDNAVMLSTDVMSRGIDIQDIDWVIQFEVPKLS
ncbi:DEAD/DEAH box helicase, partial [Ostertagia ostertagi]